MDEYDFDNFDQEPFAETFCGCCGLTYDASFGGCPNWCNTGECLGVHTDDFPRRGLRAVWEWLRTRPLAVRWWWREQRLVHHLRQHPEDLPF